MENRFDRLTANLDKLRKNETQMTEAQKVEYRKPLLKLKKTIAADATEIMCGFLLAGCNFKESDRDEVDAIGKRLNGIMKEAEDKKAGKVLFATYDIDQFLKALLPLRLRIWYEAYAPYWIKNCEKTGSEEFPYHNDIIGMDWWEGHGEWATTKTEGGKKTVDYKGGVTIMLPPTMELVQAAYQEEMRSAV